MPVGGVPYVDGALVELVDESVTIAKASAVLLDKPLGYFREIASAVDVGLLCFEVRNWIDSGQIESVVAEALKVSLAVVILAIDPLE